MHPCASKRPAAHATPWMQRVPMGTSNEMVVTVSHPAKVVTAGYVRWWVRFPLRRDDTGPLDPPWLLSTPAICYRSMNQRWWEWTCGNRSARDVRRERGCLTLAKGRLFLSLQRGFCGDHSSLRFECYLGGMRRRGQLGVVGKLVEVRHLMQYQRFKLSNGAQYNFNSRFRTACDNSMTWEMFQKFDTRHWFRYICDNGNYANGNAN